MYKPLQAFARWTVAQVIDVYGQRVEAVSESNAITGRDNIRSRGTTVSKTGKTDGSHHMRVRILEIASYKSRICE